MLCKLFLIKERAPIGGKLLGPGFLHCGFGENGVKTCGDLLLFDLKNGRPPGGLLFRLG